MKYLFYIILIIGISEFALSQKVLNFSFFDTSEKQKYHSISLDKDLKLYYGIKDIKPSVILLKTISLENKDYAHQSKILDSLDAENMGLLIVVSCVSDRYKGGYHTDLKTAKELEKQTKGYKLVILNSKGMIIHKSKNVLSKRRIENILLKK